MRTLFRFVTLLLCLELIVGPVQPSLSLLTQEAFAQESCGTGFTYDRVLNRCLTNQDTARVMNATASCAPNDSECYKTNAENAFQKKVSAGEAPERKENNKFMSTVGNAAAVAGPLTIALFGVGSSGSSCLSYSYWAMIAGSVAFVVGDNLANYQHKERLKKIKEDWGKIVNPEQASGDKDKEREASIEAQSQAFGKLADAEESLVKAAKMKRNFYAVAALAFAASGVLAYIETIEGDTNPASKLKALCAPATANVKGKNDGLYSYYSEGNSENFLDHQFQYNLSQSKDLVSFLINKRAIEKKHSSPSLDEYLELNEAFSRTVAFDKKTFDTFKEVSLTVLNNLNPVPEAHAVDTNAASAYKEDKGSGINWGGLVLGGAAAAAAKMYVSKDLISARTRAIFSGVLAGWTGIMAMHASSQAEASKKRADLLRKMQGEFVSASGALYACKSEDRNDPSKPNCYCYTPENQRNQNRGNSQICQKLWAGVSTNSTNYLAASQSSKTCISNKRQPDPSCACKANNTCMKVSVNKLSGVSTGTFSMLSNSLQPVNGISDGSVDAANINPAALDNQAAKMSKLTSHLEKSGKIKDLGKIKVKKANEITNRLTKASAGLSQGQLLGSTSSNNLPSNPGDAARMLEKELTPPSVPTSVSGGNNSIATPSNDGEKDLDFGFSEETPAAIQETQLAEVMKENLDYGTNDINQGSKTNIFEVLSNRYQRSGMRRLFDETGKTKAEKPSGTEISQ